MVPGPPAQPASKCAAHAQTFSTQCGAELATAIKPMWCRTQTRATCAMRRGRVFAGPSSSTQQRACAGSQAAKCTARARALVDLETLAAHTINPKRSRNASTHAINPKRCNLPQGRNQPRNRAEQNPNKHTRQVCEDRHAARTQNAPARCVRRSVIAW
jgi:hypothetical protein